MAQHGVEVAVGTEGPRGSHRPPCGDCLRLCIDDQESDAESLREMRLGVHPGAGVWQVVAAEDCPSSRWDLEVPIRSSPVLCKEGIAWHCCPSPHCRGLRAGRPVCPRSELA